MGEAKERMKLGLQPRVLKPGEQIQLGPEVMKNAVQKACECGCKLFKQRIEIYTISPLISPNGQEIIITKLVHVCQDCKAPVKAKL